MTWPLLGKRTVAVLASLALVSLAAGVVASAISGDLSWAILAWGVVLLLAVTGYAKSAHNASMMILSAVNTRSEVVGPADIEYESGGALDMLRRDLQRDGSAILGLISMVHPHGAMPAPGGWAATPDTLLALVSRIMGEPRVGTIVECGSGTSTAWMALALRERGEGRLVSLEHDAVYAEKTRAKLTELGLEGFVEIRCSSLVTRHVDGEEVSWFAEEALTGIDDISLLFVDGPPAYLGSQMRYPALPLLAGKLANAALIVLDDIDRDEEKATARRWLDGAWAGKSFAVDGETDRALILRSS